MAKMKLYTLEVSARNTKNCQLNYDVLSIPKKF